MVVKNILIVATVLVLGLCIAGCTQQAPVTPVTKAPVETTIAPVVATETVAMVTLPVTKPIEANATAAAANETSVAVSNETSVAVSNVTAAVSNETSVAVVNVTAAATSASLNVSVTKTTTTVLIRNDPKLGAILTDSDGKTLYIFKKDPVDNSVCDSSCIASWPVFYSSKEITTPDGINAGDFNVITRDDGSKQTTYKGMALYYYSGDKAPGDLNGEEYNNLWYVVTVKDIAKTTAAPVTNTTEKTTA